MDLIILMREVRKITDFNEFLQERLKALILLFVHVF